MQLQEFTDQISKTYYNHFPHSRVNVSFSKNLYPNIFITCYLANNSTEVQNGIAGNDVFHILFQIDNNGQALPRDLTADSVIPETLQIETVKNSYTVKPENRYMAYGSKKVNFRKSKGNPEKIINLFDKYCRTLKEQLTEDLRNDNIHSSHVAIVTAKLS